MSICIYCNIAIFRKKEDIVYIEGAADFPIYIKLMERAGMINKSPWLGSPAGTLLCGTPSAEKEGTIWIVICGFTYRATGWNYFPLMDMTKGWLYKKVYDEKDFNELGITEKDFLSGKDLEAYFKTDTPTD